jgi:hypothetical protein
MPEYQRPFDEVLVALGSDARRGLSAGEARERLLRSGANELAAPGRNPSTSTRP